MLKKTLILLIAACVFCSLNVLENAHVWISLNGNYVRNLVTLRLQCLYIYLLK